MRKILPLLLVFMLVLAACGGDDDDDDDGGAGGIEDAETCDEVAALFVDEMQVLLDELSDMSLSDFQSSTDEQPEAMTNFETRTEEIGNRGDELGCTDEDLAGYLEDNIDDLEADGPVPELLLQFLREGVESGEIFE
jgi:hypothetical protein